MENSLIFDALEEMYIGDYRETLEKQDDGNFTKWVQQSREVLEKTLNKEQLALVDSNIRDIRRREEFIDYNVGIRILNFGIKIGMELKKAFYDFENG